MIKFLAEEIVTAVCIIAFSGTLLLWAAYFEGIIQ